MTSTTTSSDSATITATSLSGSKPDDESSAGMKFMAPKHTGKATDDSLDQKDWLTHHPHDDKGSTSPSS